MSTRTLTGRTPVFFIGDERGPDDLRDARSALNNITMAPHTIIATDEDMARCRDHGDQVRELAGLTCRVPVGWTFVGVADVTLHLNDDKALVAEKVVALRCQKQQVLREASEQAAEIERRIETLLAIEYVAPGSAQ